MKIKALYIEPSEHPRVIEIEKDGGVKAIIGDEVEYTLPYDNKTMFAVHGLGKVLGKPINRALRKENGEIFDIVAGDLLILGTKGAETVSLSDELIKKYTEMLYEPLDDEDIPPDELYYFYGQYVNKEFAWKRADSEVLGATFLLRSLNKERGRLLAGKRVSIPDQWSEVPEQMFWCCEEIVEVDIPFGVTKIGNAAFVGCSNLEKINIPESVIEIKETALAATPWLDNQPDGVVYAGKVAYAYKGVLPQSADIVLRTGTVSITEGFFSEFDGVESLKVTIPKSVILIGEPQFENCIEDFRNRVTIRCEENSFAHAYAKEHKVKCELISEPYGK